VPRLYVPIYILIRVPLLTLFGAALAILSAHLPDSEEIGPHGARILVGRKY